MRKQKDKRREKKRKIIKERIQEKISRLQNTYFQFVKAYQGLSTMVLNNKNKNYVKVHH